MMDDYVPGSDAEFDVWQDGFMKMANTHATAWGIPATALAALTALQTIWVAAFAEVTTTRITRGGAVTAKTEARDKYEADLREFYGEWIAKNSKVANADRVDMGLKVPTDTRTPVGIPQSLPLLKIDISVPMQHTLHITDDGGHGKGKPEGAHGCEIWMKLEDTASKDTMPYTYLGTSTKASYVNKFVEADAGKKATYRGRWMNTKGEPGAYGPEVHTLVVP
jgi:hypothetical protein